MIPVISCSDHEDMLYFEDPVVFPAWLEEKG